MRNVDYCLLICTEYSTVEFIEDTSEPAKDSTVDFNVVNVRVLKRVRTLQLIDLMSTNDTESFNDSFFFLNITLDTLVQVV